MTTIKEGDTLPEATFLRTKGDDLETVKTSDLTGKIALFGLPGAFTGTCTNAHLPSFMRNVEAFRAKGVNRVICVTVNDPFVCEAWSEKTGAGKAGVEILADADGSFAEAMGLKFDFPDAGLIGRSKRYAALVEDGKITVLNIEESPGSCDISAGERLLEKA